MPQPSRHLLLSGEATQYGDQALDLHRCFLCGRHLDQAPKPPKRTKGKGKGKNARGKQHPFSHTDEDVFPKWLLEMHGMEQSRLGLTNGTPLRYSQVKIPACLRCNGGVLSHLENRVSRAFDAGYEAVAALDRYDLYLWMTKLWYGLLFKSHHLAKDRSAPQMGTIVERDHIQAVRGLLTLLQGLHRDVVPHNFPGSINVFRTHVYEGPAERNFGPNFNYWDNPVGPYIAIRSRGVGITATLLDWGLINTVPWPMFELAKAAEPLTAMQFGEVVAHGLYQAWLLKTPPAIQHWEENGVTHVRPVLHDRPSMRAGLFRDVEPGEYASALAWGLRLPKEAVFRDGMFLSRLADPDGEPHWVADRDHLPPGMQAPDPSYTGLQHAVVEPPSPSPQEA